MSNALMSKDKRKLVDIIFRKDDIHKKLKKDNEDLQSKIALADNINKDLNNKIETLTKLNSDKDIDIANLNKEINDFKDCCDEYASRCQELINRCNTFRRLAIISTCITTLIVTIIIIILWTI